MRAIDGTAIDRSSKSSQVRSTPAAAAIEMRCIVWLVDPPVARSATTPLTIAFSSTMRPMPYGLSEAAISATRRVVAAVSASRIGSSGWTNAAPGRCSPITSMSIWLELAVP
jgi:hypothetical protein